MITDPNDCRMHFQMNIREHSSSLSVSCMTHRNSLNWNGPSDQLSRGIPSIFRNSLSSMAQQALESQLYLILCSRFLKVTTPPLKLRHSAEQTMPSPLKFSEETLWLPSNTTGICHVSRTTPN